MHAYILCNTQYISMHVCMYLNSGIRTMCSTLSRNLRYKGLCKGRLLKSLPFYKNSRLPIVQSPVQSASDLHFAWKARAPRHVICLKDSLVPRLQSSISVRNFRHSADQSTAQMIVKVHICLNSKMVIESKYIVLR